MAEKTQESIKNKKFLNPVGTKEENWRVANAN